jgi:hypothetical protein
MLFTSCEFNFLEHADWCSGNANSYRKDYRCFLEAVLTNPCLLIIHDLILMSFGNIQIIQSKNCR